MRIIHIARHQLTLLARSKWLTAFGVLFTLLAILIAFLGDSASTGFQGFNRMTASLLNLNLLLVPLLSLLLGSLFISGEKEDGGLTLLLTYPIPFSSLMMGKYIGLFVAVWSVITFSYGAVFILISLLGVLASLKVILLFYLYTIFLLLIFLSLSVTVGLFSKSRFQALGISIILWAFFVLFYEFIIMGVSLIVSTQWIQMLVSISIFLNPVELIRVWAILSLDGASVFGPGFYDMTVWASGWLGTLMFAVSVFFWGLFPLFISSVLVRRRLANG